MEGPINHNSFKLPKISTATHDTEQIQGMVYNMRNDGGSPLRSDLKLSRVNKVRISKTISK